MEYESYSYHGARHMTTPRTSNGNIKGLELEISDYDSGYLLDELIEDNVLTCPENENTDKDIIITVEDDGSVYKELVFKASCNSTLLRGVKLLSEKLHGNIENGHGTSCHIHVNNRYLENIGVPKYEFVKASEFLAPILFKISGRSISAVRQWAPSRIENYISIDNDDLYLRCKFVDNNVQMGFGKYTMVNTSPSNTTELRLFSNYFNFDYDYIKMYIECTDFIIEVAKYMQGKKYSNEFLNLIEMCKDFFNRRKYKEITERHRLNRFFMSAKERRIDACKEEIDFVTKEINAFIIENMDNESNYDYAMRFIRVLRKINNRFCLSSDIQFNLNDFNPEDIKNIIVENVENELKILLE